VLEISEARVKETQRWNHLIDTIMRIGRQLLVVTSSEPHKQSGVMRIFASMFLKAIDTLRAIQLLYNADFPIQAQALIRILFEVRIDIEFFLKLCANDSVTAASRVLDAMMMQKVRQQRSSNFRGLNLITGAPTPTQLLQDEQNLIDKYGKDMATKMRNNGFTGISVEERARQLGLVDLYNIIYRNFSRNIHNTDYMEHLWQGIAEPHRWEQYKDIRDHVALSTAIACTWRAAWFVDSLLGGEFVDALIECWKGCVAFEHWAHWPELMEGALSPTQQ
jgi:hypothetical protein